MKKLSAIILLSFAFSNLFGQAGALDSTFGGVGIAMTDFDGGNAHGVVIQPDGKIIAAGLLPTNDGIDFALSRYNINGSPDSAFGVDGKVITDFGSYMVARANSVALQTDGKIVVAGSNGPATDYFYSWSDLAQFVLVRYNPNGTLDSSFGIDGKIITAIDAFSGASSVKIQSDGKIVAVGFSTLSLYGYDYDYRFTVVRYNTDGSLDAGFGIGGIVKTSITPTNNLAKSIAIQSDGKIIVAGTSYDISSDFTVVRYKTNGTIDSSFNGVGITTIDLSSSSSDYAHSVAIQSDGKIIVAGGQQYTSTDNDFALIRLNSNGTLDSSFSEDGKLTTSFGPYPDNAFSVLIQPDGKIVAAGESVTSLFNYQEIWALARYDTDGTLDSTFGLNGKLTTAFDSIGDATLSELAIQADGKIVTCGGARDSAASAYQFAIGRYLNDLALGEIIFSSPNSSPLIYPNPIQSTEVLQYTLTKEEVLTLSLYNMNGRLVKNFFSQEKRNAGEHKEEISIGNIPAGSYLLTLSNGSINVSVKVVKQ